jgi:hypothetical protein
MSKKKTPNDLYWEAEKKKGIKADYNAFLKENGKESSPDEAAIFAIKSRDRNYGMDERDLILYLVGDLPYMYD